MLRRALAPLAGLTVLLASFGLAAAPASAHDVLLSSSPADGETLTTAPTEIVLTFNNDIAAIGAEVQITDPEGSVIHETPSVTGPTATATLPDPLAGTYSVAWRVTSSDGHPIDGTLSYTLDLPAVETPAESPTAEPSTESASPEPSESTTVTATQVPSEDPTVSDEDASGPPDLGLPTWVLPILGVGILGGIVALIVRLRRDQKGRDQK